MTNLRDACAAALRRSIGQGLAWNFDGVLPQLLGELDAIYAAHGPEPVAVKRADDTPAPAAPAKPATRRRAAK